MAVPRDGRIWAGLGCIRPGAGEAGEHSLKGVPGSSLTSPTPPLVCQSHYRIGSELTGVKSETVDSEATSTESGSKGTW
jgi:hypothetical protein